MLIYKASMVNNIINASQSYSHFKANTSFLQNLHKRTPKILLKKLKV